MSNFKVTRGPRILLQELTREWEFELDGSEYTFREYEGVHGRQMWLDDTEIDDFDDPILDDLTAYDIFDMVAYNN
jgi:hypothetical protein